MAQNAAAPKTRTVSPAVSAGMLAAPVAVGLAAVGLTVLLRHGLPYFMADFSVYRAGGDGAIHRLPLYQLSVDTAAFKGLKFIYPPFAAVLFAPLSVLGVGLSQAVWTALNGAILGLVVWLTLGMVGMPVGPRRAIAASAGTALSALLFPVLLGIELGQINLLIMLLVLLDFSSVVPPRWRGVAIGIAAGLKLTPLVFIAYLLLTGRRRAGVRAIFVFLATVAVGFVVAPGSSRAYWFDGIFLDSTRMIPAPMVVNHSLSGLVARSYAELTSPGWITPLLVVVLALGLAAAVWAYRRGQDLAGVLVAAFTGLLVSPVSWPHHWVWVVPTIVWLVAAPGLVGRMLVPRLLGLATAAWFIVSAHQSGERFQDGAPYQWTVPGNLYVTIAGYLAVTALGLALLPLWLPRLRTPRAGARGVGDGDGAGERVATRDQAVRPAS